MRLLDAGATMYTTRITPVQERTKRFFSFFFFFARFWFLRGVYSDICSRWSLGWLLMLVRFDCFVRWLGFNFELCFTFISRLYDFFLIE